MRAPAYGLPEPTRVSQFGNHKIELRQVRKVFDRPKGEPLLVLDDVDLFVDENEFISVIGASGSGKTTLLFLIAGLEVPTEGLVRVDGREVREPGRDSSVVFQEDAIFPWRTVLGNIEYGLELRGVSKIQRREIARRYVGLVGLSGFEDYYPHQLSGGMKKRVALGEVLANSPRVLLLDEPFGPLDYVTRLALQEELARIWQAERLTTVMVTHDIEEALFLSDRILVLRKGALRHEVRVPFDRPRSHELRYDSVFSELKELLWREIGTPEASGSRG